MARAYEARPGAAAMPYAVASDAMSMRLLPPGWYVVTPREASGRGEARDAGPGT